MAKSRDEQRADLQAQLDALNDEDDEDDEVSITFPDGRSISGAFRRVREIAEANGFKLKADPPKDPKDSGGSNVKRFQTGRRVS